MFEHKDFEKYAFEELPLNTDIMLMDERWMQDYERALLNVFKGGKYKNVGYVSYSAVRCIFPATADLSWYANISDRFHEVRVSLPRDQFVACVSAYTCDEKPRIFVRDGWIQKLYVQNHSVFALIDAIGVKDAIKSGALARERLVALREGIDEIAGRYPNISFISFADSLLLKSNWQAGYHRSKIKYSYEPEVFLRLFADIRALYLDVIGLDVYAVLTQGSNAYYDDPLLHKSATGNHISLNSLGLPFAQLLSIDRAARDAIKAKVHVPAQLYMDECFFHSLNFELRFDKWACGHNKYVEPMADAEGSYFYADCDVIQRNLSPPEVKGS